MSEVYTDRRYWFVKLIEERKQSLVRKLVDVRCLCAYPRCIVGESRLVLLFLKKPVLK